MIATFLLAATLGLKDFYHDDFAVGVAVRPNVYVAAPSAETAIVTHEFNALTAENAMKPDKLQPREGEFRFETADKLVAFAEANRMALTGHCLVWHQQMPWWFFKDARGGASDTGARGGGDCDRETLIARMRTHIFTVMGRYKGRVKGWDVVNEAVGGDGELHDSPWLRIIGGDFVELAFRFAHEADPDAELYYNDFGLDNPKKRAGVVRLIRTLKAKGLRIDAVGMQSHGNLTYPKLSEYEQSIEAFGAEGVKVMATELDISVLPAAWGLTAEITTNYAYDQKLNPWPDALPAEKQQELAARYAALFRIYRRHRDVVSRVTVWGVSDGTSWLNDFPVRGRTDYPLLYDRQLKAKPCREAIAAVAKESIAVSSAPSRTSPCAIFSNFALRGEEPLASCDPATEYRNPILGGMAPDPSITRKGEWFYLANSSFSYFPGIPIHRSKNLVDWEFCGYVGNRVSNLHFNKGLDLSAGVFAPDIKYNPYNDTFYLIVTVIGDRGNVVYKTKDPLLGWSEPIKVPVGGIDPSFFFEDDKTAWILNNDDAPDGKAEYPGHRTVRMRKYDLLTDTCVPGTERIIINKGVHPEEKPIWCEGPHLYKIDGRYYVMTAEGGTAGWHSEVIWSSDKVEGPYAPCPVNPILTQRDLPANRPNPIVAAGHADLFQTPGGDWMAIFLAIDPYQAKGRDWCNTGRSTYLLPVKWIGEDATRQPIILEKGRIVPRVAPKTAWMKSVASSAPSDVAASLASSVPSTPSSTHLSPTAGNISYVDSFAGSALDPGWFSLRQPATFAIADRGLRLEPTSDNLDSQGTPAYLARWVRNKDFSAEITVDFTPKGEKDRAGLCYYQNEKCHYEIAKTVQGGKSVVALYLGVVGRSLRERRDSQEGQRGGHGVTALPSLITAPLESNGPLKLRFVSHGASLTFFYAEGNGAWKSLGSEQDATVLSTDYAGGFVAATLGPFVE